MIRNVCLSIAVVFCLLAPAQSDAYWPYLGYPGYGGYGWGWGFNQATNYVPAPPYYSIYPPVYYAPYITARHYGASPFAWAGGMEPSPPYLLDINQRFTRPQLFWIVKNGIKMTGMPSWKNEMSDAEIWSVVAWIEASAKLPPGTYVAWRKDRRCVPYPSGFLSAP